MQLVGQFQEAVLARYTAAGALDGSFGIGGIVVDATPDPIRNNTLGITALTLQKNGQIVIAGKFAQTKGCAGVERYSPLGQLDTTFGDSGLFNACNNDPGPYESLSSPQAIAVQRNGFIVVSGGYYVLRLQPGGHLDKTFGTGPTGTTPWLNVGETAAMQLAPDDKILLGQWSQLRRLTPDGKSDASFGTNGQISTTTATLSSTKTIGLALQPNGKFIHIAIEYYSVPSPTPNNPYCCTASAFLIARHNVDGSLDSGFGIGGAITRTLGTSDIQPESIALQSSGKLLIGGWVQAGLRPKAVVTRFQATGSPDPTFGVSGRRPYRSSAAATTP